LSEDFINFIGMKMNWYDHLANLFVVILGISIAFYLEGYRTDQSVKKQEIKYVESMILDLEYDSMALDSLIAYADHTMSGYLITLSGASAGATYNEDSLGYQLLGIQYNPFFKPQRTTYESLRSSGKMDLISDFSLMNEVISLHEQYYHGTSEFDDTIREHLRDFVKPHFMKHVQFIGPGRVRDDFLTVDGFQNMIYSYRYLYLAKVDFYRLTLEKVNEVKTKLRQHRKSLTS
jgi:hypothetical protein